MRRTLLITAVIGGVLAVAGWLWWRSAHDSSIAFLPNRVPGEWIVYPKPAAPYRQAVAELPTLFRKTLQLEHVPPSVFLTVCAFRKYVVFINGRFVTLPQPLENWKNPQSVEVTEYLKEGRNEIGVTVYNNFGPPALWLNLAGAELRECSDASWEASFAGAVWRPALLARQSVPVEAGNPLNAGEKCLPALRESWRPMSVLLLGSLLILGGASHWFRRGPGRNLPPRWQWTKNPVIVLMVGTAILWVILFTHNISFLPRLAGFDTEGHLEYIQYIQTQGKLPLASDGWEMHQPPLYYLMAFATLKCLGLGTGSFDGMTVLRLGSLLIGLAHLGVIAFALRALFPGRAAAQLVGLSLGGFLPMGLYLTHFVTNEGLAACLMSATLLLVIIILRSRSVSPAIILGAGLCLGLALLTKVTAVVLAPFVFAGIAYRLLGHKMGGVRGGDQKQPELALSGRLLLLVGAFAICLSVCGWHYFRVWRHFGNPLTTNWDPRLPFAWWQDPGFRTAAWFGRFGHSLTEPFFSGLYSFSDGVYSTLWGDGLWSGSAARIYRPPWNFNLMAAGFTVALFPSVLVLCGVGSTVARIVRHFEARWMLLAGVSGGLVLALIQLNLTVPSYASAKAFYLLSGMLPLCAFTASGWEFLSGRFKSMTKVAGVLLGWWGLMSYFVFWIQPGSAPTQALMARERMKAGNYEAAFIYLGEALNHDPQNLAALSFEVGALIQRGRLKEARAAAEQMVASHPGDALGHLDLGEALERQGMLELALSQTEKAVAAAPDHPEARLQLAKRLFGLGRFEEAVKATREALRLAPTDPELHFLIGRALLARSNQPATPAGLSGGETLWPVRTESFNQNDVLAAEAFNHFRFAARLAPASPDALNQLARILATDPRAELRSGHEAVQLAQQACKLTQFTNADMLETLALSDAEAGDYSGAILILEKIEGLIGTPAAAKRQKACQELKQLFQSKQPYHQPRLAGASQSN